MMSRKQTCMSHSTRQPGLAMHNDSRKISKANPKIRIIHVFAPEIIKTDVANFRELVQRLTGKPTENGCLKKARKREESGKAGVGQGLGQGQGLRSATMSGKMELRAWGGRERVVKEEEEEEEGMWNSGGFLSGLSDLEGFIQDYGEFPLLSFDGSQIHCFEGTPFSSSLTS